MEIYQALFVWDQDAFVGNAGSIDCANDLIGLRPTGNQDDVHGILYQPGWRTYDRKSKVIDAMGVQERR